MTAAVATEAATARCGNRRTTRPRAAGLRRDNSTLRLRITLRRGERATHATYCVIALVMWSGLPLESLISFAQTFSISETTFFGIGT